jgi:lysophospholipase L1-like esterase
MKGSRVPHWLKRLVVNVAVLVIGLLGALGLFEVLLRIHNPFMTRIRGQRIVLEVNRKIHFKNTTIRGLDSEITYSRNAIGFRGPNPPADFARSLTLMTVGGSTTLCMWVSDDKTWTALLGDRLSHSFRNVWINNAGLDGHSTFGHLILLEDYVAPLHPKMVVFLVGTNDVAREANSEWDAVNAKSPIMFGSVKFFLKSMSAYSEVAALLVDFYRAYEAHRAGLGHLRLDITKMGRLEHTPEELRVYLQGFVSPERQASYAGRLRRLIGIARRNGIEPAFLTQPLVFGPAIDDRTGIDLSTVRLSGALNGQFMWAAQEVYNDVTRQVCRDSSVMLVDLARQMPKSSRYFYDAMHFTNAGSEKVAEIVARGLCPEIARRFPEYVVRDCAEASVPAPQDSTRP